MATHTLHYSLPSYIPLKEAAKLTGLPAAALRERIAAGTIRAITLNGEMAVSKQSAVQAARQGVPKEKLPEYRQFEHLKGQEIWVAEAGRKYGLYTSTLTRWASDGIIRKLRIVGNKVFLNEQDVAYCAFVYGQFGGQGKRIFNPDGTPYTPRALQTA